MDNFLDIDIISGIICQVEGGVVAYSALFGYHVFHSHALFVSVSSHA